MLYYYYCFESCISVHKIILMFLKSVTKAKVNFQLKYEKIIVISFNFRLQREIGIGEILDTLSVGQCLIMSYWTLLTSGNATLRRLG